MQKESLIATNPHLKTNKTKLMTVLALLGSCTISLGLYGAYQQDTITNDTLELNEVDQGLDGQFYKISHGCTQYFNDASKSTEGVMSTLQTKYDELKKAIDLDNNVSESGQEDL